jgi:hypothetical protein
MTIWFYIAAGIAFILGCRFGFWLAELPVESVAEPSMECSGCAAKEAEIQALLRGMS